MIFERILAPLLGRRAGTAPETRSAPSTWDLLRAGVDPGGGSFPVLPHLAENLSAVSACVAVISEVISMLPLHVYRRLDGGGRVEQPDHPVARLFREPNDLQTGAEIIEQQTAHTLLRGASYAEIVRDGRGAPVELLPMAPGMTSVVRLPGTRRIAFDYSDPHSGRTRRLLAEEVFALHDRSDDGITGKSRLQRAAESFRGAIAAERYAAAVFSNNASLGGVLSTPDSLGPDVAKRLKTEFQALYTGPDKSGAVAVLEEGLKFTPISAKPDEAQALESRKWGAESIYRLFGVPGPVVGSFEGGNYSSISEVWRQFYATTVQHWLTKWERTIERSLLSEEGRRLFEVEFDADLLLRGDMLTRFQAYRIGREIGTYSANDTRRFEHLNPRTDADADAFLSPMNMNSEQVGRPRGDRGGNE